MQAQIGNKDPSETGSQMGMWRQKGSGDMNYDALLTSVSKNNQPNLVRDAFIREHHRKNEVMKYYDEIRLDKEKEEAEKRRRKNEELDWEKRYVTNEVNIFQVNQQREQAIREEQKRKYAEELKNQYLRDQEEKLNKNRMTVIEKKINYDNLQVII